MLFNRLLSIVGRAQSPEQAWADRRSIEEAYDVAVVGGGVRALAVANACAASGAKVALFAPGEAAAAPDERAWPVLRAGKPEAHRAETDRDAVALARRVARRASGGATIERAGCLTIADSRREVEALVARAAELKGEGVSAWMVPTREIEALSPPLAGGSFPAALLEQDAVVVDADALALALAESAAAAGARMFPATPIDTLERGASDTALKIGELRVEAKAIVLADDLAAIRLVREGRGRLSLVRDERTLLTTAPGAPAIGPAIEFGELRLSRDRTGAVVASGPRGGDAIALELTRLAPSFGGIAVAAEEPMIAWRGIDGLAQVGAADIPGLWLALGFGRDALALSLPAAEHLAALIAGRSGAGAFEPFAPTRRLMREAAQ